MKHKLSSFLIGDLILFAALLLAPPLSGIFRIVQTVLLLLSGLAALWLIVQISRQKETISGVLLLKLEPDDQFNNSKKESGNSHLIWLPGLSGSAYSFILYSIPPRQFAPNMLSHTAFLPFFPRYRAPVR